MTLVIRTWIIAALATLAGAANAAPASVGYQSARFPWEAQNDVIVPNGIIGPGLPKPPELHIVKNAGHFDFLAPCTPPLAARVPEICGSAAGFDRAAFHEAFNLDVSAFFAAALEAR